MRLQNYYTMDKIFPSESFREKPIDTTFSITSMLTPGKDKPHEIFSPKDSGPSSQTYEIIMVSLCGSIFLLAVAAIALKAIRKRVLHFQSCDHPRRLATDLDATEMGVAYITAKHYDSGKILTAQVAGPVCIRYVPEKQSSPVEFLTLEARPESNAMLPFPFASSITPLDLSQEK